jgi:hypothetical protein
MCIACQIVNIFLLFMFQANELGMIVAKAIIAIRGRGKRGRGGRGRGGRGRGGRRGGRGGKEGNIYNFY